MIQSCVILKYLLLLDREAIHSVLKSKQILSKLPIRIAKHSLLDLHNILSRINEFVKCIFRAGVCRGK